MRVFSKNENEKLKNLDLLKREYNVQAGKDLMFSRINKFPFECEENDIFLNFAIGRDGPLIDPCLLYIPLNVFIY